MKFADLRLAEPLLRAIAAEGYVTATPIQARAIGPILAGKDVLGCAQTGTGKTAAFALPILQRLSERRDHSPTPQRVMQAKPRTGIRCLVLSPTRELATQIGDSFRAYGRHLPLRHTVIFGGVGQNPQVQALRSGVEIVVATPGRLLDLMNQGHVDLRGIEVFVLDEADRMLDMGFINDIRRIVAKLPAQRQTLMFSATMPSEIRSLADSMLRSPVTVEVAPVSSTAERIDQSVYFVEKRNKPQLLTHLYHALPMSRTLVFTRTKHGADRVVRTLHARGIRAEAIHGNKSQNARERALGNFRSNKTPILVATDIAARGIDIDDITHVVNFDLTHEPETYVHRIGRTARAGASGMAISFCDREERENLRAIEKLIRRSIAVRDDHPLYSASEPVSAGPVNRGPARRAHHRGPSSTAPSPGARRSERRHSSSRTRPASSAHAQTKAHATSVAAVSRPHPLYGHAKPRLGLGRRRPEPR